MAMGNRAEVVSQIACSELGVTMLMSLCGEYIGSGLHRDVFCSLLKNNEVIKLSTGDAAQSALEWELMDEISRSPHGKYFYVPTWCSNDARVLMGQKTQPYGSRAAPDKIPALFNTFKEGSDLKASNFGWIGNQLVCHDYGNIKLDKFIPLLLRKPKLVRNDIG